jgi:IclR family transcriptional regulator, KDG regulon repressor
MELRSASRDSGVASVLKALAIVDLIAEHGPSSLAEIRAKTGLPKSTLFRLLATVCQAGYLDRTPQGNYALAVKLWRVGAMAIDYATIHPLIAGALRTLVDETSETAHYSVYEGGQAVQVEKLECSQPIRAHTRIGGRSPGYASATGKALLAHQPADEIKRVAKLAKQHTPATICDMSRLVEELSEVRRTGCAFNRGEWRDGVWSVAGPVFDYQGQLLGSIGVSGPQNRVEPALDRIALAVLEVSQALTPGTGARIAGGLGSAA